MVVSRGNTRPGKEAASIKKHETRLTPEEHAEWHAMARYRRMSVSDYLRWLVDKDRTDLVASGKRPPRR